MREYPALVILVILLFHTIAPSMVNTDGYRYAVNCRIPLLAVNPETREGSVVEVEVEAVLEESPKDLIEYASPTILADTVSSFELAVLYAALVLNGTPAFYRYSITSKTNVRGLSATLGFLAALLLIHSKGVCPVDYTATGLVIPGGVVGPVGMLEEKINTALKSGLKKLHVPQVQLNQLDDVPSTVRGVYTVIDLYEELTGKVIEQLGVDNETIQAYHSFFSSSYHEMVNETQSILEKLKKLNFEEDLTIVLDRLSKAESAYARGKYYVASSLAYTALLHALRSYLRALASVNPVEFNIALQKLLNTTRADLEATIEKAHGLATRIYRVAEIIEDSVEVVPDIILLDLLVNVYTRLTEASFHLELARKSESLVELVDSIAMAYSRVITAKTWLSILERVAGARRPVEGFVKGYNYVNMLADVSARYLSYLIGFNVTTRILNVNDTRLALPVQLANMLFSANLVYRNFNLTSENVPALQAAIAKALAMLQRESGSIPVYPVLLLDLVEEYLKFEKPQNAAHYLLIAFAHAFTYLYVYSASKWKYPAENVELRPVVEKDVIILPLVVIVATGTLMILLSVAKMRRSRTEFLASYPR